MYSKILTVLSAVIITTNAVTNKQACMYCKRADTNAGFMTSFSYCGDAEDQRCIANSWEFI